MTEVRPVPGHCFTQETKRRIGELGACGVAFVVRDVSVHEAPQPLDRIEMRAIGRGEMQLDPAPGSRKPFLHQLGVMIARVVEKDMDERQHRIERRDRFQEPDRRDGVDGYDLDHPGLAGREIDRAVNIDPLAPARLFDRELLLSWCPAAGRPRRMGRMHRVREQHGFVVGQGIQEIIVALDECLLLLFVEFARDDVRLVILQPQTMQKRNQSRTAFVNEAEFLFDKGADLARRARQRRADKGLQCVFLLGAQKARAPAHVEAGQALDPTLLKQFEPATDRVVVQQKRIGDFLTAPPINELTELAKHCSAARYGYGRIQIDPSVVRGLEYYTGPVFEVELTFPIEDEKGNPVRFGSVGGGGRYDGLVARFRGEPVPATGFSIGVSRLLAALRHLGKIEDKPAPGPVVVTVFDRDRLADYQRMVQQLRDAPLDPKKPDGPRIRAELYLGNPRNFGNQLKYADRRNSPCVVIQGGDEKNNPAGPHVLVKDLILGAELAKLEKGREEHLQRQAEAQRLVPEGELVEAVRAVLTRHNVTWE